MQTILTYDSTFDGFLTAVFQAYEEKLDVVQLTPKELHQPGFFAEAIDVITDKQKAARVWKGLKKHKTLSHNLYRSFLSEIEGNEIVLLKAIQYVLATGNEKDYGHPEVLKTAQVAKMVGREKHRMEAFVRFQLTKDGIYFANVEPDFNVLPLNADHFRERYADQSWVIYDLKRDYGLHHDLKTVEIIHLDFKDGLPKSDVFTALEGAYGRLWKDYFTSTNIKSRINLNLHLRHVPRRYWKYLNEKTPD